MLAQDLDVGYLIEGHGLGLPISRGFVDLMGGGLQARSTLGQGSILSFEVREATNGQEAVARWQKWEPHLIWMDLRR